MKRHAGVATLSWLVTTGMCAVMVLAPMRMAIAQPGPGGRGPCAHPEGLLTAEDRQAVGDRIMLRMQERLGLTQAQAEEIRGLLQAQRDRMREEVRTLCEAQAELRRLMDRQDADLAALKGVADRVKALQGALLDQRIEMHTALRSKLTPEQWQKWLELRRGMGPRHRGRGPAL